MLFFLQLFNPNKYPLKTLVKPHGLGRVFTIQNTGCEMRPFSLLLKPL